ncbi:hypothetical protein FE257_005891 [Aspergillus nanangensis]|uniref:Zn(2)-C6 fungal-type domain-containing protein n=1 Tax=Aspergillus nanangensis TaxID=2582783 RepID=A0AAD4GV75_ASPNN|nr:hypothetical protein FE257_005891 [Aspergillus nanangensis]
MDLSRTSPEPNPTRIERRRTVGESPSGAWSSRPKSAASACERCRRRKIRCDGETPCATCRRFSINCIRPRKNSEGQAALEQRVHQLEARIVELSTTLSNAQGSYPPEATPTRRPSPPSLHLFTDFAPSKYAADSGGEAFSQFPPDSSPSTLDIPRIEIVDFANSMSPVSLPPSPYMPCTSPNPIPTGIDDRLLPPGYGVALSPPMSTCPSPNYDPAFRLSPGGSVDASMSRRSSFSSLGLDTDYGVSSFPTIDIPGDELSPGGFNLFSSPEDYIGNLPTVVETEALLDIFFQRTTGLGYPLGRDTFRVFLDVIDDPPQLSVAQRNSYSPSIAKFHVYMAMAIGLRMKAERRPRELQLLETCYRLAITQVQSHQFWEQPLAGEASILLMLFTQASQTSNR